MEEDNRPTRRPTHYQGVYEVVPKNRKYKGKPDNIFYVVYWNNGKKIFEKVGSISEGYSAKTAAGIRGDRIRDKRHGVELPRQKKKIPLFKDLAGKYLKWAETNRARAGREDKSYYQNHLAERFDNKRLNEISSFDLERMKSELLKKGLAPASVKHCLVLFRQMVNKANAWGLYSGENPIKGVKLPSLQNQRERFLSYEEADRLLKELAGVSRKVHDMALLSLQTGMRAGEVFNLKGQDIDLENSLLSVMDPKNKQSRKVYLTPTLSAILKDRIPDNPEGYVFKDRLHGGQIQFISQTFRKTVKRLEFNKGVTDRRQLVNFHTLRHTFASWLALQGTPILTISQLLGHKSLAMTQRYSHLSPDHKKDAIQSIERLFNEKRNGKVVLIIE
jgi:integrase